MVEDWQQPDETAITKSILTYLKKIDSSFVWKIHGNQYTVAGLPDICFIKDGKVFFFEVKTPSGRATKLQLEIMEMLRNAGAACYVVTSRKEVQKIIERRQP